MIARMIFDVMRNTKNNLKKFNIQSDADVRKQKSLTVDFSAEMERTLQVLDYAVLVISAADGLQGHVLTLWRLLERYRVPVFLFLNKMDQPGAVRERVLDEIQKQLDTSCIDFGSCMKPDPEFYDSVAMCDEQLMEEFLVSEKIETCHIQNAIMHRKIFPCLFGSALKQEGVDELLKSSGLFYAG